MSLTGTQRGLLAEASRAGLRGANIEEGPAETARVASMQRTPSHPATSGEA